MEFMSRIVPGNRGRPSPMGKCFDAIDLVGAAASGKRGRQQSRCRRRGSARWEHELAPASRVAIGVGSAMGLDTAYRSDTAYHFDTV